MSTIVFRLGLALLVLAGLSGCTQQDRAVQVIQENILEEGQSVRQWVAQVAGASGTVKWDSFHPDGEPAHVRAVDANITRPTPGGEKRARVQWLVNLDTGYAEMRAIEIDGQPRPLLAGMLDMALWPFSSAKDAGVAPVPPVPVTEIEGEWNGALEGNGAMTITRAGSGYAVEIKVWTDSNGCGGMVDGQGALHGDTLIISKDFEGQACSISIKFSGTSATLEEQHCLPYHGFSCGFNGTLKKVTG